MGRLIDADKLLKDMEWQCQGECGICEHFTFLSDDAHCGLVDAQPTVDAVPVVRCKDCKHFTEGMAVGMCYRIPDKPILPIKYDHFCSYGKMRKEKK